MNFSEERLYNIFAQKFGIEPRKIRFLLQTWTKSQKQTWWHLFTDSPDEFRRWYRDQKLLQEGKIDAFERKYRYLVNAKKEMEYRRDNPFV